MGKAEFTILVVSNLHDAAQPTYKRAVRAQAARESWKEDYSNPRKQSKRKRQRQRGPAMAWVATRFQKVAEDVLSARTALMPGKLYSVLGAGRVDPFQSYPCFKPYFPFLVDHYIVFLATDIPEIDRPDRKGLLRSCWFPFVMQEESTFLVVMLLAAAHCCSVAASTHMALDILQLKAEAVNSINYLLETSDGQISDSLVGAVAKMASFEAMYGDVEAYRTHMTGLRHMAELRGGLDQLGLDGLLRRIVIWIDTNAAFLNNTAHFFTESMSEQDGGLREPNPSRFIGD